MARVFLGGIEMKRPPISEKDFQKTVIDMAHLFGWRVAHFRPAMTKRGRWVTPVQADGAGFPDLLLIKCPSLIVAELKSDKGKPSEKQKEWLRAFNGCYVSNFVWRPSDLDAIEIVLRSAPQVRRQVKRVLPDHRNQVAGSRPNGTRNSKVAV